MKKNIVDKEDAIDNAVSFINKWIRASDKENYKICINELKGNDGKWTISYSYNGLIEQLKSIMEQTKQDGQDIYEQFAYELNETNYPTEIKEKLLAEIKNDLFSKPSENKKEHKNEKKVKEIEEIEKALVSLELPSYLFANGLYDYGNQKEIKKKLSSLPFNMQKKIIKNYGDTLEFFDNPSKELCLYTIKNYGASIWSIPEEYRNNDLDIQLAIIEKTSDFSKKIKLLPQARITFIKKYPTKIITEITKENYNQTDTLTIYDLSKEELKIYQQSLEEYFVNKVKNDPTAIKEIKNPSQLVRETALQAFKEQYIR